MSAEGLTALFVLAIAVIAVLSVLWGMGVI